MSVKMQKKTAVRFAIIPVLTCLAIFGFGGGLLAAEKVPEGSALQSGAQTAVKERTTILFSKETHEWVELTIISQGQLGELYTMLAQCKEIPYAYLPDGGNARAHKMVLLMEEKHVRAGKAFIEGSIFMNDENLAAAGYRSRFVWSYAVAPVVMVDVGGTGFPYILAPSLFSKPVTYEVWKAKVLSDPQSKIKSEYFKNRFAYDPSDKYESLSEYRQYDLRDMKTTNKKYSRLLELRQMNTNQRASGSVK